MKKNILLIGLIGTVLFFGACSPKITPVVPATNEAETTTFVKMPATAYAFQAGNHEIKGPLRKEELEGAVVSLAGGTFIITPETNYQIETSHEKGGILRDVTIEGGDPITLSDHSIWFIENAFFKKGAKNPDSISISVISPDSVKFCMTMQKTAKGIYVPKVVYKIVKKKVFSELVRVYSLNKDGSKNYVKFKKSDGTFIEKYKIERLPGRFFKDKEKRKLKSEFKIQRIPIMIRGKDGKLHQKMSVKKIYETDNAGFKFISPCGGVYYLSNKNIRLEYVWVKQEINDGRQMIHSSGYKSPNDK